MRRSRFATGSVYQDWEWEAVKTPEEWWWDYAQAHPEYDPRVLPTEKGMSIYGPPFSQLNELLAEKRLEEGSDDDVYPYLFMVSHFGEAYKYQLQPRAVKTKERKPGFNFDDLNDSSPKAHFYDPMRDAPQAYLHFCRLSRLLDMGWGAKRVINEIIKFADKYGPPWHPEWVKWWTPPFEDPPNSPLTVDRILLESQNMAWAVEAYHLLSELNEDVRATPRLKVHMARVLSTQDKYELYYNLTREYSDYTYTDWDIDTRPSLDTEVQVAHAAIALIMGSVNEGVRMTSVKLGLTAKLEKDTVAGSWAPKYAVDSLLGAMWLQFYLEILDKGGLRECANENCRRFFPVSRSNKEYCSKGCGVKQYMREHRKLPQGGTK